MKTHEFVSAVQESARIPGPGHAEQAVKATLIVLDRRLSTEGKDVAVGPEYRQVLDQLPGDCSDLTQPRTSSTESRRIPWPDGQWQTGRRPSPTAPRPGASWPAG